MSAMWQSMENRPHLCFSSCLGYRKLCSNKVITSNNYQRHHQCQLQLLRSQNQQQQQQQHHRHQHHHLIRCNHCRYYHLKLHGCCLIKDLKSQTPQQQEKQLQRQLSALKLLKPRHVGHKSPLKQATKGVGAGEGEERLQAHRDHCQHNHKSHRLEQRNNQF
ncbi:G-box-binding factor-like [Stomoxys calcitrans]|uniref:G-box-binding factor-like n=1 Tax=Stomoxys calcitrans TaxID=35570 RepID=UPI0027E29FD1|nr:G-box-binding factor-like [Stomoxys calcitrans]